MTAADGARFLAAVGAADEPDSLAAGARAAGEALCKGPNGQAPRFALLFSTSRHDPARLLAGVRSVLPTTPVYGGYAVGIITNERLGYDGYQVGIALIWGTDVAIDVLIEEGLADSEAAVGRRLAARLQEVTVRGEPSLLLLYDSVNRTGNGFKLNMATPLLDAACRDLDQAVPIVGAGLVGDMRCDTSYQWLGDRVATQAALAILFSGAVEMRPVVLHGCRPASAYHTITRVDENVVLEIDGEPALDVIDRLLGKQPGQSWRDYAFFVTLGVNRGDRYAPFEPEVYANRMCMRVDAERKGLVMFEPDLRAGDEVQLMLREVDLSYIGQTIEGALAARPGEEPVLALYIDCAGRASAYSYLQEEEASYVQAALAGRCPLLGFYSGVEIARVAGQPQALDWTGVLCLLYAREAGEATSRLAARQSQRAEQQRQEAGARPTYKELVAALGYYGGRLDRVAGDQVRLDARMSALSGQLRRKEQGFALLAAIKENVRLDRARGEILYDTLAAINATMSMARSLLLAPARTGGGYEVEASLGFSEAEVAGFDLAPTVFPSRFLEARCLLANKADRAPDLNPLREALRMPYFLAVPVALSDGREGVLVAGRDREMVPFYPPFTQADVDTFLAIAAFLSSVLANKALYDGRERLLDAFRRFVPEAFLQILNRSSIVDIELGDQVEREMAILILDIRSFTTLSERMPPGDVFGFINEFLAQIGPVIREHDGFVAHYLGDGVMALFEDPATSVRAAIALQRKVRAFSAARRAQGRFPVSIGIGLHVGVMMLGAIGEAHRLETSVLSDAVNLAFRLEALTKAYGAQILTTQPALDRIADSGALQLRTLDLIAVKGKRDHVALVEVLDGGPEERVARKVATGALYDAAFQSFEYGVMDEAATLFRRVLSEDPDDKAAALMLGKARAALHGGTTGET